MKEKIVLLTHKENNSIKEAIRKLNKEKGNRSLTVLSQNRRLDIENVDQFVFNFNQLYALKYSMLGDGIVPGHAHFPLFYYWKQTNDQFDYYWLIEYDVRFNGNWSTLFNSFENHPAGLITSHIKYLYEEPEWSWWDLSHPIQSVDKRFRVRSFNPVCRLSIEAMTYLDQCFKSGWKGHNEVVLPTLLMHGGFEMLDLNGGNKFSSEEKIYSHTKGNRNGDLNSGSFRHRPAMNRTGFRKNTLYHPVKENGEGFFKGLVGDYYRVCLSVFRKIKFYFKKRLIDY